MGTACQEGILGNVGNFPGCWIATRNNSNVVCYERESERAILTVMPDNDDEGKSPHFWHSSEGDEEGRLALRLKTPLVIQNFQMRLIP